MAIGQRFYVDVPTGTLGFSRANACAIYEVTAINTSGGVLWLQLFLSVAVPVLGEIPQLTYRVGIDETICIAPPGDPSDAGRVFSPGFGAYWSTTQATYTAPGAAAGPLYVAGRDLE
jgi:hypothetical protein